MSLCHELREMYPDWAKITPAKRRILQYLVDQGGEVQFWPGNVLRSMAPLSRLEHVGYVNCNWQGGKYVSHTITADGRAALAPPSRGLTP